jgi:hypothetical protein
MWRWVAFATNPAAGNTCCILLLRYDCSIARYGCKGKGKTCFIAMEGSDNVRDHDDQRRLHGEFAILVVAKHVYEGV